MQRFAAPVFWTITGGAAGLFVTGLLALVLLLIAAWVIGVVASSRKDA